MCVCVVLAQAQRLLEGAWLREGGVCVVAGALVTPSSGGIAQLLQAI